nr:MAG TPA: hypothetical protein [Caudoviricetes sp.]
MFVFCLFTLSIYILTKNDKLYKYFIQTYYKTIKDRYITIPI